MSSVIDKDDKVWLMFLDYCRLVDAEATNASLDIYGTEQRSNIALKLAGTKTEDMASEAQQDSFEKVVDKLTALEKVLDKVVFKLTALEKQNAAFHKIDRYNQGITNA